MAGLLFTITYIFLIVTGGLSICHEIRRRLLELPPSEPQWLQNLLRTSDCEFIWDVTRDMSRAATSDDMEGLEGQDEIQIDEVEKIGDEGKGNAESKGVYVSQTLLLYIYQAGPTSTTYVYFSYLIFFLFFFSKKNVIFYLKSNMYIYIYILF